jgi:hypothetical protein
VGLDAKTPLRFGKHLFLQTVCPKRILVKDPIALLSAGWLHEQFGFKVVCMIRHPLAFAGSIKKAGWQFDFRDFLAQEKLMDTALAPFYDTVKAFCQKPGDIIDQAALLWKLLHFIILNYQEKYPFWLYVKYESLASDPLAGFQEIFDHLDLTLSGSIRATIETFTSEENPVETATTRYQPRNAMASLNTWQARLTPEEAARVIDQTREIAGKFYDDL